MNHELMEGDAIMSDGNSVQELETLVLGGELEELKIGTVLISERDEHLNQRVLVGVLVEKGMRVKQKGICAPTELRPDKRMAYACNGQYSEALMDTAYAVGANSHNRIDTSELDYATAASITGECRNPLTRRITFANPHRFIEPNIMWAQAVFENGDAYVAVSLQYRAMPQGPAHQ